MLWSEFDRRGQIRFGQNLLRERRAPAGFHGRNHFLFIGSAKALQFCYSDLNKLYQKWYNIYCIFRGDHDLINLLCLIVCRYKSFFFFSLVVEMQFDIKKHAFEAKPLNEADIVVLETGTLFPFSRCLASFLFCVAQDGMICFGCSTNIVCWV